MKVCSIFSQVLKLFSRGEFEQAVKEHKAERHARGFTSWGQFMAMPVLPVGARAFAARDLRRPGVWRGAVEAFGGAGGTQEIHPGLRQ